MKKQLLFAFALGSAALVSATAPRTNAVSSDMSVSAQKLALESSDLLKVEAPCAAVPLETVSVASAAQVPAATEGDEGNTVFMPYYYLTQSNLYTCNLLGYNEGFNTLSGGQMAVLPAELPTTWSNHSGYTGDTPDAIDISWEYQYFNIEDNMLYRNPGTSNDFNLVTPAPTIYAGYYDLAAPTLTFNGVTYNGAEGGIWASGAPIFNFGDAIGHIQLGLTEYNYDNLVSGTVTTALATANWYQFARGTFTNWVLGAKGFPFTDTNFVGAAMALEVPEGAYFGLEEVYVECYVQSAPASDLKLDVYKFDRENSVLGERLGGGYLKASDIVPNAAAYQRIGVPIVNIDGEGDDAIEEMSFVNITGTVAIVISGGEGITLNTLMMRSDARWHADGLYVLDLVDDDGNVTDKNYVTHTARQDWKVSTDGSYFGKQVSFCFFYKGQYSWIDVDDNANVDNLEVVLPAEGGTANLTLYPYTDFFDGAKYEGNGVGDWLVVYPDNDQDAETGAQELVFDADALPAGVAGRGTVVAVQIPGATVNVTVRQGDTSGIDSVSGDAAQVVSSQIFDLQGRQLNAVPESGLYIRRDVKADNTVSTVKVVK